MARIYKNNWSPQKLVVSFNQKQWRQDLASFIVNKLNWFDVRVSRSKMVEKSTKLNDGVREFEIYDNQNNILKVKYSNKNEIIETSHSDILDEYMSMKGM